MTINATASAETHVGMVRKNNEDACLVHRVERNGRSYALWVVADGMGGGVRGEVASDLAISAVREHLEQTPWTDPSAALKAAFARANSRVWDEGSGFGEATRSAMGTTMVAVLIDETDGQAWFANVGDSRAYVITGGVMEQVSQDHSVVAALVEAGRISAEEARTAKERNVITRSIGMDPTVVVDVFPGPLAPGERVILCSDGLYGMVTDEEIRGISESQPPAEAVETLVALANEHGGRDNITVVIGEIASTTGTGTTTTPLPLGRWKQNRLSALPSDETVRMEVLNRKRWQVPAVLGTLAAAGVAAAFVFMSLRPNQEPGSPDDNVVSQSLAPSFLERWFTGIPAKSPSSPAPTAPSGTPTRAPSDDATVGPSVAVPSVLRVARLVGKGDVGCESLLPLPDAEARNRVAYANPQLHLNADCTEGLNKGDWLCIDEERRSVAGEPPCFGVTRIQGGLVLAWGATGPDTSRVVISPPPSQNPAPSNPQTPRILDGRGPIFVDLDKPAGACFIPTPGPYDRSTSATVTRGAFNLSLDIALVQLPTTTRPQDCKVL